MREFLFKAKRVDNGEWVKGNLIKTFTGISYIAKEFDHILSTLERYEVDPSTICQYTGLTDKNGRKIWENDLLDCQDRITVVKWNIPCGTWDSIFVRYKGQLCSNGINVAEWKYRAEVIGNRFDNPDLLEGGK